jgi:hypothetical protein
LFPTQTIATRTGAYAIADSLMSVLELQALYERTGRLSKDSLIVEFGHFLGGSTCCMAKGALDGKGNDLLTIDSHTFHPLTREIFEANMARSGLSGRSGWPSSAPTRSLRQPSPTAVSSRNTFCRAGIWFSRTIPVAWASWKP